jgi:hypothetical protein
MGTCRPERSGKGAVRVMVMAWGTWLPAQWSETAKGKSSEVALVAPAIYGTVLVKTGN